MVRERRGAAPRRRARARTPPRAARRATCADRRRPSRRRQRRADRPAHPAPPPRSRRRRRRRGTTRRCSRHSAAMLAQRIDRAGADRSRGADDEERQIARGAIGGELLAEARARPCADGCRWESSESPRCRCPRDRRPSESTCASRPSRRRAARPRRRRHPVLAHVPVGARGARREEADQVRHVAAADQQAAAVAGIADQLGDPADGLHFDLGRRRRQQPRADVRVERRREQVAEDADRRGRRGDVAEEPRVAVEERVIRRSAARSTSSSAAGSRRHSPGSDPFRSSASRMADGDSSRVTGRSGIDSSSAAI